MAGSMQTILSIACTKTGMVKCTVKYIVKRRMRLNMTRIDAFVLVTELI